MKDLIRTLWRSSPKLLMAFVAALSLTLYFIGSITWQAVYWANHRNMAVQPWMTVGYVANSWGLNGRDIDLTAGLPLPDGHPLTLIEIAVQRGVPVADVVAAVEAAIVTLQAKEPKQ